MSKTVSKAAGLLLAFVLLFAGLAVQPPKAQAALATDITINPIPNNIHRISPRYTVSANNVSVPVVDGMYQTTASDGRTIKPGYLGYDYATFTASTGDVNVVIHSATAINSITVSPLKYGIAPTKIDSYTYQFTMTSNYYLIVYIDGNRLMITRDDPEPYAPTPGAQGVFDVTSYLGGIDATNPANVLAVAGAFQQAVNDASAYGTAAGNGIKGIVNVPAGLYYMGNLMLKSNVALYLAPGSVIRFPDDYSSYHVDFYKSSLNRNGTWWIYTENNSTNIKVYGRGEIDGNGHYLQKDKPPSDPGFAMHALMIMGTSNFTFDGPVIRDIPFWGTVIARSHDVYIKNAKFFNSIDANENDCIDVNESQHIHVYRAIAISLDDNYSTKTWAGTGMSVNWYGTPQILDDVTFNTVFGWSYCCATFKIGHGAYQNQSNITFKNSVTYDAGRAIGIEHVYGTGSYSNITFDTIDVQNAGGDGWFKAVIADGGYGVGPVSNITIKNITIRHAGSASSLKGYSDAVKISGITFDNIKRFDNPDPVTGLGELNITKTGYYDGLSFVPDRSLDTLYRIQAEYDNGLFGNDWTGNHSIYHKANYDSDGTGYVVSSIADGNYALYKGVGFGANTSNVNIRYDAPRAVRIELHTDSATGPLIGSTDLPGNNGTWSLWNNYNIPVSGASGVHDLYIVFKVSGSTQTNQWLGSLNWFELTRSF